MEIPQGCGPGKYAVVKSMEKSSNQIVPGYLAKRSPNLDSTVYDLTSDYDFTRVPRDMGSTQMRIDFSNETGYWDMMVDKAGNKRRRKRDLEDFQGNHRRWLYDAWRDDNHENSDLSMEELHKRWFGSSVIDWLKGLLNGVTVTAEKTFSNNYQDNFKVILTDESYYCNLKGVDVEATLKTAANVGINVDTNLGLTIIGTIGDSGVDLKDSYVYFRNKGTVSTLFTLDAFASASFSTGDILILSADKFGVTFSVPGILTVGPNLKLYGSVDASFSLGAHLESNVNLVSWDVQQTYPIVTEDWQPKAIQSPDRDGTQELLQPTFNYSITADGHLTGHIKPMIVLGLDFHTKWIPLAPVTIGLVADGSVTVCATASASNSGGISACYGVNAGADLYATVQAPDLFGWKLSVPRYQLAPSQNIQIVPEQCTSLSKREDDLSYSMSQDTAMTDGLTLIEHRSTLKPRGAVYGPLSRFSALGITGTCPGDKTQGNDTQLTNVTCNNCGTYQEDDASVENVPLNRKRQNSAPSCQYLPGNGMGSRHSNELSARSLLDILGSDYAANESYHEIERRDSKSIEWYTGTTDYDVVSINRHEVTPSCKTSHITP